jgi:hypothetical protein
VDPSRTAKLSASAVTALMLVGAVAAGLAATAIWAASAVVKVDGLTGLACAPEAGEVMIGLNGKVFVTDEDGVVSKVLAGVAGGVSGLARLSDGTYAAAEYLRRAVAFYDADGVQTALLERPDHYGKVLLLAPDDAGGVFVADSEQGFIEHLDAEHNVTGQIPSAAPSGIGRWDEGVYWAYDMHTSAFSAFDAALAPVDPPKGSELALVMGRAGPRGNAVGAERDSQGHVYLTICAGAGFGEAGARCMVSRARRSSTRRFEGVAGFGDTDLPTTSWTREARAVEAFCFTSRDDLLVSSGRYTELVAFSSGGQGPPGPFGPDTPAVAVAELAAGQRLAQGNSVRRFGDETIRAEIAWALDTRLRFERIESVCRHALYGLLALLVLGWMIDRALGSVRDDRGILAALGERAELVFQELIKADRGLPLYLASVLGVFAVGAALGYSLGGFAAALAVGLVGAKTLGRRIAAPRLLASRGSRMALRAFVLQLGPRAPRWRLLEEDEELLDAWYEMPQAGFDQTGLLEDLVEEVVDIPDDPTDVVDFLSPPFVMVAVTDRRVIRYACGLLGRPRSPVRLFARPDAGPSERPWPQLAAARCEVCGAPLTAEPACGHQRPHVIGATVLGTLLPGAGHLALGDMNRGRLLVMVFMALALDVVSSVTTVALMNFKGGAAYILTPSVPLAAFWLFAVIDLRRSIRGRVGVREELGLEA